MAAKFVSQLETAVSKLEFLVQNLQCSPVQPSKAQFQSLGALCLRLSEAAGKIPHNIDAIKERHAELSFKEGRKQLALAQSDRKGLVETGELKNRGSFARNIIHFFDVPKDSIIDSTATKARKTLTRERCERICDLSPDGIISWAATFTPTTWTANLMSKNTFDYVIEGIEPDGIQVWPSDMYQILHGLAIEEPLRGSHQFHEFLEGKDNTSKRYLDK